MDNIDIYNDSAIILEQKTPKSIISWITILIILLIIFCIFCFIPFNKYKSYTGYISVDKDITYVMLKLDESDFPISKRSILYIKDNKYEYEIMSIENNNVLFKLKLDNSIKIDNNIILVNILKERITLKEIIKKKIKKGFGL